MKARYPGLREVGAFEGATFDPLTWTTAEPVPPFANRLPDDTFWAARQVMAFTDEEIRAIVRTGEYSQPAEDWITAALVERRNRIGRAYFSRVLPLDRFRITGNTLEFDDLAVVHGFSPARTYTIEWHGFDNAKNALLDTNRDRSRDSLRRAGPRRWRLRRGARVRDRRRHERDGVRTAAGERLRRRGTRTRMARKDDRPARAPGTHGAAGLSRT